MDVDVAKKQYDNAGLFSKGAAQERLRQVNDRVTGIAMNMNNSEIINVKTNDPYTAKRTYDIHQNSAENMKSINEEAKLGVVLMEFQYQESDFLTTFTPVNSPWLAVKGGAYMLKKYSEASVTNYTKMANESKGLEEKILNSKQKWSGEEKADAIHFSNANKVIVNVQDNYRTTSIAKENSIKPSIHINPQDKNISAIPGTHTITTYKNDGSKVTTKITNYTTDNDVWKYASIKNPRDIESTNNLIRPPQKINLPERDISGYNVTKIVQVNDSKPTNIGSSNNYAKPAQQFNIPDDISGYKVTKGTGGNVSSPSSSLGNIGTLGREGAGANSTNSPGGATTDRAQIKWNEGEWPFNPIFGLLYQISYLPNK